MPHFAPTNPIPVALCLGGMDPSAGAGLVRDALTLAALGVHPMVISTAETVQNGVACEQILAPSVSPTQRLQTLRPHLAGPWGVKLGLSALEPTDLQSLLAELEAMDPGPRIWDPIQAPTCGVALHDPSALRRMAAIVLKSGTWVVAPNRPEAAAMGGVPEDSEALTLARAFLESGARAVWLKGGHGSGAAVEDFWIESGVCSSLGAHHRQAGDRRGTGCTVASAWLGYRLLGLDDRQAARQAIVWLREHWAKAFLPGGVGRPTFAPEHP